MSFGIHKDSLRVSCTPSIKRRLDDLENRRLYLYGEITDIDAEEGAIAIASTVGELVECIFEYNRIDRANNTPGWNITCSQTMLWNAALSTKL